MNISKLAQVYQRAATAVGGLIEEASHKLGAKIDVTLPLCHTTGKNGFFVIVDGRNYEFESFEDSLGFLQDLCAPHLEDTALLNCLDDMFPDGWRLCLEHGLCPIEPGYALAGVKNVVFQGDIRACLVRIHDKANEAFKSECC